MAKTLYPIDELGINEKDPNRLYFAYEPEGGNLAFATTQGAGGVLFVDFLPGNYPSLRIAVADDVQAFLSGMSPDFFGFCDPMVCREVSASMGRYGVVPEGLLAEVLEREGE